MRRFILTGFVALTFVCGQAARAEPLAQSVTLQKEMVVTANPLASAAGAKILKQGGTAVQRSRGRRLRGLLRRQDGHPDDLRRARKSAGGGHRGPL